MEVISPLGQESIPLLRMDDKANGSCLSPKAKEVRKPLLLSPESLKIQAEWSAPDASSVKCSPLTLFGSQGPPNWLQGGTPTTLLPLLFVKLLQHKKYTFVCA